MKYGVREICNVVFKAKGVQKVGNRIFYKDEPVMYFDTLKTSSLEAASASVYAQGGRGNPRLIAWDGDRTLTFNMEDALISSEGLQILAGAGLLEASSHETIKIHATSQLSGNDIITTVSGDPAAVSAVSIVLPQKPYWATIDSGESGADPYLDYNANYIYVMVLDQYGEVFSEPFIPDVGKSGATKTADEAFVPVYWDDDDEEWKPVGETENKIGGYKITLKTGDDLAKTNYATNKAPVFGDDIPLGKLFVGSGKDAVLVDYYVEKASGAQQIEITADKFGGTYYIEADTLFRTQQGLDMPAEFIIPNGKIQSNFTLSMAATGDPSTFTFTVDAMPDYTRFDKSKKVLAAIQIIQDGAVSDAARERTYTAAPGIDTSIL